MRLRYAGGAEEAFGLDSEHKSFPLRGEPFAVDVEIVARLPFGMPNRDARLALARVVHVDVQLERLVRRLELVCEAAEVLDGDDAAPALVEAAARALGRLEWPSATGDYVARQADTPLLRNVWELPDGLDPRPPGLDEAARASVAAAAEVLDGELAAVAERHPPSGSLLLTGHAHLDLAWRWPLDETRRKARRTLWTQAGLLERHPELHFNQSTAQVYAFLEEDDPALLERLAALAAERRLEPIGGMWVEPDCNMPAGESLVRQLLYGQRWFQRRFGAYHSVCWLPDCFGFTPALPQLLAGAGIRHFFTAKLNWSETNQFPHDLFWWEGLDGTRVLAHSFENPDGGYNGRVGPRTALVTWRNYRGRVVHPESLLVGRLRRRRRRADRRDGGARPRARRLPGAARAALRARRRVLRARRGGGGRWSAAGLVGRAVPRAAPRDADDAGADEAAAPARRARPRRGRGAGGAVRARRRRPSRRRSRSCGACCCATSSTTSCRARACARSTRTPSASSARWSPGRAP